MNYIVFLVPDFLGLAKSYLAEQWNFVIYKNKYDHAHPLSNL